MNRDLCIFYFAFFALASSHIERCYGSPYEIEDFEDIPEENLEDLDTFEQAEESETQRIRTQFEDFVKKYNKVYLSSQEKEKRMEIFAENLKRYKEMNEADMGTATYGVDQFSDMTVQEFKEKMLTFNPIEFKKRNMNVYDDPAWDKKKAPKNFDWRLKGKVTPVKNQGSCGSCWAFSAVANLEGLYAIKYGKQELFSEQQVVDCTTTCHGCMGGWMSDAVESIKSAGGLEKAEDYPYTARTQQCVFNKSLAVLKVKENIMLPKDEIKMTKYLFTHGPVSVAIDARALSGYRGGIAHPPETMCSKSEDYVNHGVTLVGYGVHKVSLGGKKKRIPYWIIKNSWGASFGRQGYYLLYRGDNSCAINTFPSSGVLA